MDIKSKILFSILAILLVLSVSASYYRFIVLHDYVIEAEVDCDPTFESCFVWICDPEVDGEDVCTGDLGEDTWYYKYAHRNAMYIPVCNTEDETCKPFQCPEGGEEQCEEVLCTPDTLIEHELSESSCISPEDYFHKETAQDEVVSDGYNVDEY